VTVTGEEQSRVHLAFGVARGICKAEDARFRDPSQSGRPMINGTRFARQTSKEDLLQRTPGVFLQWKNGREGFKISIRGSDINPEDEPLE